MSVNRVWHSPEKSDRYNRRPITTLLIMPVTPASLGTTAYKIGSPQNIVLPVAPPGGPGVAVKHRGIHTIYPLATGRINLALTAPTHQNALTSVAGVQNNAGNSVYLKYFDEEIT